MAQFRILCSLAAGIGYIYHSPIEKWRSNFFKLHAELPEELQNMQLHDPRRVEEITRFGMPQRDIILNYKDFELSYDNRTRVANWVVEHLNMDVNKFSFVAKPILEDNDSFIRDHRAQFSSFPFDYVQSGFVKCHLADKHNHADCMEKLKDTYASTTIAPQTEILNRGAWCDLEFYARRMLWNYSDVYVFTGPLYFYNDKQMKYQVIGMNNVAVPTHFFKVIIGVTSCNIHLIVGCYIIPNQDIPDEIPLGRFRVPWWEVQEKSGLTFLTVTDRPYVEDLPDITNFREARRFYIDKATNRRVCPTWRRRR